MPKKQIFISGRFDHNTIFRGNGGSASSDPCAITDGKPMLILKKISDCFVMCELYDGCTSALHDGSTCHHFPNTNTIDNMKGMIQKSPSKSYSTFL